MQDVIIEHYLKYLLQKKEKLESICLTKIVIHISLIISNYICWFLYFTSYQHFMVYLLQIISSQLYVFLSNTNNLYTFIRFQVFL